MDFKIKLPPEDCQCDAKVFYDKYRKQVDSFIQKELAKAAKTAKGKRPIHFPRISTPRARITRPTSEKKSVLVCAISTSSDELILPKIEAIKAAKHAKRLAHNLPDSSSSSLSISDLKLVSDDEMRSKIEERIIVRKLLKEGKLAKPFIKKERVKKKEIRKGEIKKGEIKKGEVKKGEVKKGEVKKGEVKKGEAKKADDQKDEDVTEESLKEESETVVGKKVETKKEVGKKKIAKKVEGKKVEGKKVEGRKVPVVKKEAPVAKEEVKPVVDKKVSDEKKKGKIVVGKTISRDRKKGKIVADKKQVGKPVGAASKKSEIVSGVTEEEKIKVIKKAPVTKKDSKRKDSKRIIDRKSKDIKKIEDKKDEGTKEESIEEEIIEEERETEEPGIERRRSKKERRKREERKREERKKEERKREELKKEGLEEEEPQKEELKKEERKKRERKVKEKKKIADRKIYTEYDKDGNILIEEEVASMYSSSSTSSKSTAASTASTASTASAESAALEESAAASAVSAAASAASAAASPASAASAARAARAARGRAASTASAPSSPTSTLKSTPRLIKTTEELKRRFGEEASTTPFVTEVLLQEHIIEEEDEKEFLKKYKKPKVKRRKSERSGKSTRSARSKSIRSRRSSSSSGSSFSDDEISQVSRASRKTRKTRKTLVRVRSSTSRKEVPISIQLKKRAKSRTFIDYLKARAAQDGHDESLVQTVLDKAKENGQDMLLLNAFYYALDDNTLSSIFFALVEALASNELEMAITNIINEYKRKKREAVVKKLMEDIHDGKRDSDNLATIIADAKEDDPDDEFMDFLLKRTEEKNLGDFLDHLSQEEESRTGTKAEIDKLVVRIQREQTNELIGAIQSIALAEIEDIDQEYIDNLLFKIEETGHLSNMLPTLYKAKESGNLGAVIKAMFEADDTPQKKSVVIYKPFAEMMSKRQTSSEYLLDSITGEQEKIGKMESARGMKAGKKSKHSGSDIGRRKSVDEQSEEGSGDSIYGEMSYIPTRTRPPAPKLRRKMPQQPPPRPFRKQRKGSRDYKTARRSTARESLRPTRGTRGTRSSIIRDRQSLRRSRIEKAKLRLLYRRKHSFAYELPAVDYSLIVRDKLSFASPAPQGSTIDQDFTMDDIDETQKGESDTKSYSKSFLQKIYGPKTISSLVSTYTTTQSVTSKATIASKKKPKKAKSKVKIKEAVSVSRTSRKKYFGKSTAKSTKSMKTTKKSIVAPKKFKKHIIRFFKKKSVYAGKDVIEDSDESSYEMMLEEKISTLCEMTEEDRSERGYLVGFRYKDDEEAVDWSKKDESTTTSESLLSEGEWVSRARRRAVVYFKTRKIEDFFHFLATHLISDRPGDPIKYLIVLLENCIHFRNGKGKPPLIFEHYHVESLYSSMDVFNDGFISLEQYCTGMETMYIHDYNINPKTNQDEMVPKETFIREALKGQRIQLRLMLRGSSKTFGKSALGSIWSKIEVYQEG